MLMKNTGIDSSRIVPCNTDIEFLNITIVNGNINSRLYAGDGVPTKIHWSMIYVVYYMN
jgi:hypothetical protein